MIRDEGIYLVKFSTPRALEKNVPVSEPIILQLERDIDVTQDFDAMISLQSMEDLSMHPIQIEAGRKGLKIKPAFDLLPDTLYRLTLRGGEEGIRDIRSIPIEMSWSLEFTTGAGRLLEAPVITKPIDKGIVMQGFGIAWTPNSEASHYEVEIARTNTFDPVIWPGFGVKAYQAEAAPHLFSPGRYYMRVRAVDTKGRQGAYSEMIQFMFESAPVKKEAPASNQISEEEMLLSFIETEERKSEMNQVEVSPVQGLTGMIPEAGSLQVPLESREIRIRFSGVLKEETLKGIIVTKERMG